MSETGYGSDLFLRACAVAPACLEVEGRGPRAALSRMRAGSLTLARYGRGLPSVAISPSASPAGQMLREHLAIRERGRLRYRSAQAVLSLPGDFAQYLRGRSRQAVRTNVGHARRAGLTVTRTEVEGWEPGLDDTRRGLLSPGPVEWWRVYGPDGAEPPLAEAIVTVDDDVALLHGLGSSARYARWLVHTAVVESLCGRCRLLLVNSDDAYLLSAGNRHFQRLLGYDIARLELPKARRPEAAAACTPRTWGSPGSARADRVPGT